MQDCTIKSALISVYNKEGLEPIVKKLSRLGVEIYSTGGTYAFIDQLGIKATLVEDVTEYPSIFGGRVKTLHPKIFGGLLGLRTNESHLSDIIKIKANLNKNVTLLSGGKGTTGYDNKPGGKGSTGYDASSKALQERFQKLANIIK